MDQRDIQDILDRHARWRKDGQEGQCATFRRMDLRGSDFAGRDLTFVKFSGCDLRGSSLRECNLSYTEFICCDLRQANLRGAQAAGVDFHGSDLCEADLRGFYAGLGSNFGAADLRGARIEGMHLRKTNLHGAWMSATDLRAGVGFEECVSPCGVELHGSVGPDWSLADLHAKLQWAVPNPEALDPRCVAAYELGTCGPALLDVLQETARRLAHGVSHASRSHETAASSTEADHSEQQRQEQAPRPPRQHER